jgi:hypothetical protein
MHSELWEDERHMDCSLAILACPFSWPYCICKKKANMYAKMVDDCKKKFNAMGYHDLVK